LGAPRRADIRAQSAARKKFIGIMMDTQGPAIRTGDLAVPLDLQPGQKFILTVRGARDLEQHSVDVNYENFINDINVGDVVLIDNGAIEMKVLAKAGNKVECEVLTEGTLGSRRHINLPGVKVSLPALTAKDIKDVKLGLELGVDFIALSFVREARDLMQLKELFEAGKMPPLVIAKIEDQQAVANLESIVRESDAVMVARGDLGIEIPYEELPIVQRRIVKTCLKHGKPVIVATHMLESMIESPMPTRAEVTDVANAIYEETDAIMLSGETTVGKYPLKCIEVFDKHRHAHRAQRQRAIPRRGGTDQRAAEAREERRRDGQRTQGRGAARLHAARSHGHLRLVDAPALLAGLCNVRQRKDRPSTDLELWPFPARRVMARYATGGRGGSVYHVTTLADSGPGSFRDAVSRGGRTIVFDVGGYITLYSAVSAASGLTIAGQTAPGGGIGLMGNELSFYGENNIICRHFRVRQGGSSTGSSAINIGAAAALANNMIFDHISVEFGQWDSIDAVHTRPSRCKIPSSPIPSTSSSARTSRVSMLTWYGNLWVNAHNRQPLARRTRSISTMSSMIIRPLTRSATPRGALTMTSSIIISSSDLPAPPDAG
jgi:hypothetical protein